jgi:hypothetical protein
MWDRTEVTYAALRGVPRCHQGHQCFCEEQGVTLEKLPESPCVRQYGGLRLFVGGHRVTLFWRSKTHHETYLFFESLRVVFPAACGDVKNIFLIDTPLLAAG